MYVYKNKSNFSISWPGKLSWQKNKFIFNNEVKCVRNIFGNGSQLYILDR